MRLWNWLRSWLRAILRRTRLENEMDAELHFHIEAFAEDLVRSGVPLQEAYRRARIEFGGIERAKEECRDARGVNFIESLIQDLRYGLRMLRKNPGFASTVILTLGLGIGLNSAIFTVASGFLLREPPAKDPPNVVMLTMVNPAESWDRNPVTPTEFSALRGQVHSFEGMAAVLIENLPLIGRGDPESVTVARVTSNYFALLGVPARLGRTFAPGEDSAKQQFNAIISSDLWQRKFNADPAIVGKTVTLGGQIYTVIGIMPERFEYVFIPCAVWIPDSFDAQSLNSAQREDRRLNVFARLKTVTILRQVQVRTNAILERLAHDSPAETAWLAGKVQVDSKVFLFTCVISLLTVLLFGVLPALKSSKLEIQAGLHGGGSAPSRGRRESRLRSGFVVGQIALTVILIAATGASIQMVIREMRARLGFDPKGVLSVGLSLPTSKYPTIESQAAL